MPSSRSFWKLAASSLLLFPTLLAPHDAKADPQTARVHIDERSEELEQLVNGRWVVVCTDSCDRDLPAGWYRLTVVELTRWDDAEGQWKESPTHKTTPIGNEFHLDPSLAHEIRIGRNRSREGQMVLGGMGAVIGGVGLVAGLLMLLGDAFHCWRDDGFSQGKCQKEQDNLQLRDAIIASAGATALVGGIVAIALGKKQNRILVSPSNSASFAEETAKIHRPIWRPIEGEAGRRTGAGQTIPIFTGHF